MTTYRFAITGIRQHDFANRLDELYDKAMGKRMSKKIILRVSKLGKFINNILSFP